MTSAVGNAVAAPDTISTMPTLLAFAVDGKLNAVLPLDERYAEVALARASAMKRLPSGLSAKAPQLLEIHGVI